MVVAQTYVAFEGVLTFAYSRWFALYAQRFQVLIVLDLLRMGIEKAPGGREPDCPEQKLFRFEHTRTDEELVG